MLVTGRRNALKLLSGSFVLASFPWQLASANARVAGQLVNDQWLGLMFDDAMRTRVIWRGQRTRAERDDGSENQPGGEGSHGWPAI